MFNLTAWQCRDKLHICMLTNIHDLPQEGNFRDEQENMMKLDIMACCNHYMDYVGKKDRVANRYSISCVSLKWMKRLFFHQLVLAILNSYKLLSLCGGKKTSCRDYWLAVLRNMLALAGQEQQLQTLVGRPPTAANICRLDTGFNQHLPRPSRWVTVMCAVWVVCLEKHLPSVLTLMWPFVSIKPGLWIITQICNCKISLHATLVYKV